jgi:daunorubicin resistance ABC transporter membrane protein
VNALAYDWGMIAGLWRRDLMLFLRQRSRLLGALLPPLLLWLAIGAGMAPSFAPDGGDVGYLEYFYPGVIFMLILQVSISATMSVIEDRRQGLLQGVLVAPGSRSAMVLGKTSGSATVALLNAVLFVALAPLAGFSYSQISWPMLMLVLGAAALALTGMGFMIAWALDSIQGYHVVMNLVLFPLWILSGAMFPTHQLHPVMAGVVRWNPLSYVMSGLRRALYGSTPPPATELPWSTPALDLTVILGTTLLLLAGACWVASRPQKA